MPLAAGVYKCIDANGNKTYRAAPCTDGQNKLELNVKTGGATDLNELEKQQTLSQKEQEAKDAQKKQEEQEQQQKLTLFKKSAQEESDKNQFLIKSNPKTYSAFAIPPYQYENLPPLVKAYQDRLPDIERMRRQAAERTLATGQCGRVESVELNQKSTASSLVILVDCSSAKKFYVTEQELSASTNPQ